MPNRLLERLGADYSQLIDQYETIVNRCADEARDPNAGELSLIEGLRSQMTPLGERIVELRAMDDQRLATFTALGGDPAEFAGVAPVVAGSSSAAVTSPRRSLPPLAVSETQLRSFMEAWDDRRAYNEMVDTSAMPGTGIENRAPVITPAGAQMPVWMAPVTSGVEPRLADRITIREAAPANSVEYLAVTAPAVLGAVGEAQPKPESGLVIDRRSAAIVKRAGWSDVSWEMLSDFDSVEEMVNIELTSGLIRAENAEIVAAITADPGVLTPVLTSTSPLLSIFEAKQALRSAPNVGVADLVIIHPDDFGLVAAEQAETSGLLLGGGQAVTVGPQEQLWGMATMQTVAATKGQVLLGVAQAAAFFLREGPRLFVDIYSQSTSNLNRVILEERFATGVLNPGRWAKFELPDAAAQRARGAGK